MVAAAVTASFFWALASVTVVVFGGSGYHQAIGGWKDTPGVSPPTVISMVPSVPMMISPNSAREPLKNGENWLVLTEEYVSFWPLGYL